MTIRRILPICALTLVLGGRLFAQSIPQVNTELPPATTPTDSDPNTASPPIKAYLMGYDSSAVWKRVTFGQATMANSLPVVLSSNQSAIPTTQSGTWIFQPGNTANTTPWLFTISQAGNAAQVNGSGQLSTVCANCSGSGVSQVDNSGFTPGTSVFVPLGAEVDDASTAAATENSAGAARMTPQRGIHINLRNQAGTEIGTASAPVRTDPTGTTTQPVSGTVTANFGTLNGASTAANQATANSSLSNIDSATSRLTSSAGPKAPGTATATTSFIVGGTYNSTQPTWTNTQEGGLQLTARGAIIVNPGTETFNMTCSNCTGSGVAQNDNTAFTAGTSPTTPASGFYHATRDTLTDGRVGAIALTSKRAVFASIEATDGISIIDNTAHAMKYIAVDPTSGAALTPSLDVTQDTTTTISTVAGPATMLRASAAAPTAVGADDRPVFGWALRNGSQVMNLAAGSTLIASTGSSLNTAITAALPVGTNSIGYVASTVGAIATTTDSALACYLGSGVGSAASTNATNCKASPGNLYGVRAVNTTATLYYLRLYNTASAPTCSSSTGFLESIPIPASATGAGIVAMTPLPLGYSTGISFCLTAGSANNDNTNAATGVFATLYYK
jgi:hypothetical protein